MEAYVTRTLAGLVPADDDTRKLIERHKVGTTFPVDIPSRLTRSGAWHRKYWVLMSMLGSHCESVEVEPGLVLPIRNKDEAHVAMKYATGLFDTYALPGGVVRLIKSTAFERMTPDEWAEYWPRVLDAVHAKFLPSISLRSVEEEVARMAS
jgi:hypothetical protein